MVASHLVGTTLTACALVAGEPECRCVQEVPASAASEFTRRATEKFLWQQRAGPAGRAAARRGLDAMLAEARRRGPAPLVIELLRLGAMLRLLDEDPADADDVAAVLTELGELAAQHGDPRTRGEVATLRAHHAVVFGPSVEALVDAAEALAILTDITGPGPSTPPGDLDAWCRLLSRALNGLVIVLLKLGAHELADEVSQRAVAVAEAQGSPMERLVHQLNRVRLQLSWALRLERGGRQAAATTRFVGAAQTAQEAARLWGAALGRERAEAAAAECSIIGSAFALAHPGPEHLVVLDGLHEMAHFTEDRILLAIATSRCLVADGRRAEAARALEPLRAELGDDHSEAVLAIALHREFAHVHEVARGVGRPSDALTRYATALEAELWDLREARLTALRSHAGHHRLAKEHGAAAAQALSDPLTGLPNRRALDGRLAEIAATPDGRACSVALIDLDGFKDVNDALSHAAGDAVLQVVARCLRSALRAHDLVARYGGDEFVVVLPETPLTVAQAALVRAAEAVSALPRDVGGGVTISVGVVRLAPGGDPRSALAEADAAMYRAKRAGGNRVAAAPYPTSEAARHHGRTGRLRSVPPVPADPDAATTLLPRVVAAE